MDIINLALLIVGLMNLFFGLVVYFNDPAKIKINKVFSLLAINVALWNFAVILYRSNTQENINEIIRFLYIVPLFIPILFYKFTNFFSKFPIIKSHQNIIKKILYVWTAGIIYLTVFTNTLIRGGLVLNNKENIIFFGSLFFIYTIHYIFLFSLSFIQLITDYVKSIKKIDKKRVLLIFLGTFISSSASLLTNLFLPWYGYFDINWLGTVLTLFFVGFIMYGTLRYKLFNIKVIATELFMILIIIALSIDLFSATSGTEILGKTIILLLVLIAGYFIIRSVYKEVSTRKHMEKLTKDLQKANKNLEEISKQKSEFVSIATHQLRSPVSAIRGYSSMILEGSFGKTSKKVSEAVDRIYQSSSSLAIIIEDFLNLSRIEQGRIKYDFEKTDVRALLKETITEVKSNIIKKGLKLDFNYKKHTNYESNIDVGKIKQVFSNIIDNAVKYTPKGFLKIYIEKKSNKILVSFKDSGIGINKYTIPKLFKKFSRDSGAHKTNIHGTGLGLYVVKKIIEAHQGKVWVESAGEGKGSEFYVELKALKD